MEIKEISFKSEEFGTHKYYYDDYECYWVLNSGQDDFFGYKEIMHISKQMKFLNKSFPSGEVLKNVN
jgi:hypothetical protein